MLLSSQLPVTIGAGIVVIYGWAGVKKNKRERDGD